MKYKITLGDKVYVVEVERGEAILTDEYDAVAPDAPVVVYAPAPAAAPVPVAAPVAAAPAPAAPAPAAVPEPAPAAPVVSGGEPLLSPLPGSILSIKVNAGDMVKAGQLVLLIEAMKMENEVLSPRDGVVAQIVTHPGANVSTGDTLLVIK